MLKNNVLPLEPFTMALFASGDYAPGFQTYLCNERTLSNTVRLAMFCGVSALTEDEIVESAEIVCELRRSGSMRFEEGWLELRSGLGDVIDFLTEKVKDAVGDAAFSDKERAEQHQRADQAEARHAKICEVLRSALGPQIADVAQAVKKEAHHGG